MVSNVFWIFLRSNTRTRMTSCVRDKYWILCIKLTIRAISFDYAMKKRMYWSHYWLLKQIRYMPINCILYWSLIHLRLWKVNNKIVPLKEIIRLENGHPVKLRPIPSHQHSISFSDKLNILIHCLRINFVDGLRNTYMVLISKNQTLNRPIRMVSCHILCSTTIKTYMAKNNTRTINKWVVY